MEEIPISLVDVFEVRTVLNFVGARALLNVFRSAKDLRVFAEEEAEKRVADSEMGRIFVKRHPDCSIFTLAFSVEICPEESQYISTSTYARREFENIPKEGLSNIYDTEHSLRDGWSRVLYIIDGFVIFERCECMARKTRFETIKLSMPHLLIFLDTNCIHALEDRVPIDRQEVAEHCWREGFTMYI